MKALPIEVYSNKRFRECANGGITEKYDELLLLCNDGYIDIEENDLPENLVVMKKRELFGETYFYIEPYNNCDDGCVGWMMGGSYAASSDSRFYNMAKGFNGAVPVHDRQEKQEKYY